MLTPQEVSSHAFTKAMVGGYNMSMVDEFLDELTDDYTALYKENAVLKAKMKVLVEKVEDYRATEDSMRATLLTAQKMADSIIHEAEEKRSALLAQAETDAQARLQQLQQELNVAEARLEQGKRDLAQFITATREVCTRELAFLEQLPELPMEEPVVAEEQTKVNEIEERVMAAAFAEQGVEVQPPLETPDSVTEDVVPAAEPEAEEPVQPEIQPEIQEDLEATRRIDLNELKFGRNYGTKE